MAPSPACHSLGALDGGWRAPREISASCALGRDYAHRFGRSRAETSYGLVTVWCWRGPNNKPERNSTAVPSISTQGLYRRYTGARACWFTQRSTVFSSRNCGHETTVDFLIIHETATSRNDFGGYIVRLMIWPRKHGYFDLAGLWRMSPNALAGLPSSQCRNRLDRKRTVVAPTTWVPRRKTKFRLSPLTVQNPAALHTRVRTGACGSKLGER